jgi:hypothetical protein
MRNDRLPVPVLPSWLEEIFQRSCIEIEGHRLHWMEAGQGRPVLLLRGNPTWSFLWRGVEHRPVAEAEVAVLLFEPASTLNTGHVQNERTVAEPERI